MYDEIAFFVSVDDRCACGWDQGGQVGLRQLLRRANLISAPWGCEQCTKYDQVRVGSGFVVRSGGMVRTTYRSSLNVSPLRVGDTY